MHDVTPETYDKGLKYIYLPTENGTWASNEIYFSKNNLNKISGKSLIIYLK